MRMIALSACLVALSGCASGPSSTPVSQCLDARKSTELVAVESPVSVVVRQSPSRQYRVLLGSECPALTGKNITVSLSNGMLKPIHVSGRSPVWATQVHGAGRICGVGFDRLVVRRSGDDLSNPPYTCPITSVEPL